MVTHFLLCYPVSFHMLQLLLIGRLISSYFLKFEDSLLSQVKGPYHV